MRRRRIVPPGLPGSPRRCSTISGTTRPTCSACRGVGSSHSSSRFSIRHAAGGWCSPRRRPARSWCRDVVGARQDDGAGALRRQAARPSHRGRRLRRRVPARSRARLAHASARPIADNNGYYLQLAAIFGWTSLPWLFTLGQPTLVMAGGDDPLVPTINARILQSLIPNSRLEIVDCGHLFPGHRPRGVGAHRRRIPHGARPASRPVRTPHHREHPMKPHAIVRTPSAHDAPLSIDPSSSAVSQSHLHRRSSTAIDCAIPTPRLASAFGASRARSQHSASSAGPPSRSWTGTATATLECFFAVPMMGAVLHTVNVRISPEQVLYTINHAETMSSSSTPNSCRSWRRSTRTSVPA